MNSRFTSFLFLAFLLFGTCLSAQTFTNYTTTNGLASDNVLCVATDGNTNVWFGTQSGITQFNGTIWTSYNQASHPGLVNDNIEAIAVMSNGDVWAGTSFGVSVYDGTNFTSYTSADGLGNNQVKYIAEGQSGVVWFGTINGISSYDGTTWTSFGTSDGIPFGGVNHIEVATNGDLWLSGGLSGTIHYDGTAFTTYSTSDGLVDNKIRATAIDANDQKWVGTASGITVLDNMNMFAANHTRMFIMPPPDTLNPVEDVKIDSRGWIWAGIYVDYLVTEGGVSFYANGQWTDYDVSDGLVGPVVRRLAIDAQDNIWVATSTGVSRISNVTVGATPETAATQFAYYPNPVADQLNVTFPRKLSLAASQLALYNTSMQQVAEVDVRRGMEAVTVDMATLPAGIYFLRLGTQVEKVVKR